jgi:hypothetical protein
MFRVGQKLEGEKNKVFTYPMCEYDENGFVDASKYIPVDFDLLLLECENDNLKFNIYGWHTGNGWDGFRYNGEKVLRWKKKHSNEDIIKEYH